MSNKTPRIPVMKMCVTALKTLGHKKGLSAQNIKKFIATTYDFDVEKNSRFINAALIKGVSSGDFVQVTGKGACGSFKLSKKARGEVPSQSKLLPAPRRRIFIAAAAAAIDKNDTCNQKERESPEVTHEKNVPNKPIAAASHKRRSPMKTAAFPKK